MKQIMMLLATMLFTCCSSESEVNAQGAQTSANGKVLVAYFSFTNKTKAYAEKIAEMTGGDLYEIVPEVAYGSENSNYYDETTRAYKEQYNTGGEQRPAIKETLANASQYDIVFLGSPIWYGKSPRIILTFLDILKKIFSKRRWLMFASITSPVAIMSSNGTDRSMTIRAPIFPLLIFMDDITMGMMVSLTSFCSFSFPFENVRNRMTARIFWWAPRL